MKKNENKLPHWDMSVVFPGLESTEFEAGFQAAKAAVDELTALFEAHKVQAQDGLVVENTIVTTFEAVVSRGRLASPILGFVLQLSIFFWEFVRAGPLPTFSGRARGVPGEIR